MAALASKSAANADLPLPSAPQAILETVSAMATAAMANQGQCPSREHNLVGPATLSSLASMFSSQLYHVLADGVEGGLRAVGQVQLLQDVPHVRLHRLLGDAERQRDLLVRMATGDLGEDLPLALC
jgi:hypothetical protein